MKHRRKVLQFTGFFSGMLLLFGCFFPGAVLAENPARLDPSGKLDISNSGEPWTEDWEVFDTALDFPGGGRAGFYRRPRSVGDANPEGGRMGVLYLLPESRQKPVRIVQNRLQLEGTSPHLKLGIAANRNPRGEWRLTIKINDRPLVEEMTVSGSKGWQDLVFDLTDYAGQTIDILIEAASTGRRNEFVFVDYILLEDSGSATGPGSAAEEINTRDSAAPEDEKNGFFDRAYQYFLELLDVRESKRSQQVLDRSYQDQPVDDGKR